MHTKKFYGNENLTYENVKAIRALFSKSGALGYAEQEMNRYFELAIESLKSVKFIPDYLRVFDVFGY